MGMWKIFGLSGPSYGVARLGVFNSVGLCSLLINMLGLALPVALLQVYDRVLPNKSIGTATLLASGVAIAIIAEIALRSIRSSLLCHRAAVIEEKLGNAAVDHMLATDLSTFERVGAGTHIEKVGSVVTMREQLSGQSTIALFDLPFAFVYLAVLGFLSGWLVLLPIACVLFLAPMTLRLGRRLHESVERLGTVETARSEFVIATLSGLQTIKSMSGEARVARRYEALNEERATLAREVELCTQSLTTVSAAVGQVLVFGSVIMGSLLVINGSMSVGAIAACTLLTGRALQPFQAITGFWARRQSLRVAERQAQELFAMPTQKEGTLEAPPEGSVLSLRNVGLDGVFHGVSFDLRPGRPVAIVGPTGAGKSMLLAIAAGLYAPTAGQVYLNGRPMQEYAPEARAHTVCMIGQQETLFRGSILDNLTGFRPELEDDAMAASIQVGLDDIVRSLPRGYQTEVGDALSSALPRGLAQQIAIARALAMQPQVLLFDDADTALDDGADIAVRRTLTEFAANHSLILVSHRPSMLKLAHDVYRLADGELDLGIPTDDIPPTTSSKQEFAA